MISIDNSLNETTRHAHVLLPGLSALEQHHFDDLIPMWQVRSAQRFSEPVFDPGDRPHEWEILTRLGAMCAGIRDADIDVDAFDDGYFGALAEAKGVDPAVALAGVDPGAARCACSTSRSAPARGATATARSPTASRLQSFRDAPHGIDMGPMVPRVPRDPRDTPSGKIDLAPEIRRSPTSPGSRRASTAPSTALLLTSRRHLRSNNSWMHNVKVLVKGKDRCTLLIHPDDAARAGVADGALARVSSEAGSVEIAVEVSDEMMPGVVSLPHGWGHDKAGTRMAVAARARGREQQPARARRRLRPALEQRRGQRHPRRGRPRLRHAAVTAGAGEVLPVRHRRVRLTRRDRRRTRAARSSSTVTMIGLYAVAGNSGGSSLLTQ